MFIMHLIFIKADVDHNILKPRMKNTLNIIRNAILRDSKYI